MPLGSPQGPTQSEWRVSARSVAHVGDYPVDFNIAVLVDNPDDPAVGPIVQKLVDLIDGSEDFDLGVASRTYAYTEAMTPTA
ncbi:hypothetical protein [Streptomyces cylindrosporus]|uniref:Uncharacterized protein n=1 Tax=Streptomyces cylindrosporus TaxID=2927583 RepID=A0ABS9Y2F3_9ACTN|nr:hypothetical protein [Streptomyces cylindrosporus]MCI3271387.1 hypothetical protein [Streptomyces cylindrosporus]